MSERSSVGIDRVKVLVLGDSGVGKTSLLHLITTGQALPRGPGWTAGCNVEVRYHEYAAGTSRERPYFVELWDIGGSAVLEAVRPLFYGGAHGYIFVHDMTNRKSLQNLKTVWLSELNTAANSVQSSFSVTSTPWSSSSGTGSTSSNMPNCLLPPQAPCLLIGTKLDALTTGGDSATGSVLPMSHHARKPSSSSWPGLGVSITAESICKQVGGAEHITVDCHNARSLAPGSSNSVAISRFFDKVIDAKLMMGTSGGGVGVGMLTGGVITSSSLNGSSSNNNNSNIPSPQPGLTSSTSSTSSLSSNASVSLLSGASFPATSQGGRSSPFQRLASPPTLSLGTTSHDRRRVSGLLLK